MPENPPLFVRSPLNRGLNAVVGICLLIVLFVAVGPAVGGLAMTGLGGLMLAWVTFPIAYMTGALPAAVTGLCFGVMWIAGLNARSLYSATAAIGGASSFASASLLHDADLLYATATGVAGVVAAVVSVWLSARVIGSVEADRHGPQPASDTR